MSNSATAADTIVALGHDWSGCLSFVATYTIAELATICMELENVLFLGAPRKVLILRDSIEALLQLIT